ncbi:hypothetical protein ACEPAH_9327 [Sanghuangporus vaninii]
MSLQKRHGRFAAWIEIDGQRAEEFGSGVHGRTEICLTVRLLPTCRGKEVAIYAQEFPSTTSASACADVFLDGVHVGKSVLSPSQGPRCFAGSWTDEESLRPFIFSLAKNNDKQCLSEDAGKIEIRISEIILLYGVDEDENLYILPEPIEEWEPSSVVEQDEMERHIIVLADFTQQRKYNPQWQFQKFHSTPFDCHKPEPIANFEFIYGPEESLGTRRPDEFQAFSNLGPQSRLDEHTNHESCKARTTSGQLKKRTRSCDTYDGWSSCGSDPECTSCSMTLILNPDPADEIQRWPLTLSWTFFVNAIDFPDAFGALLRRSSKRKTVNDSLCVNDFSILSDKVLSNLRPSSHLLSSSHNCRVAPLKSYRFEMAHQSRHGRFGAWVEIDGERAEQYGDVVNGRTSTCFIELVVFVQEYPSITSACARADVYIEGVHIGKAVLSPSDGPRRFSGSWVDGNSVIPFKFIPARKMKDDSSNKQYISSASGKIVIKINEIVLLQDLKGLPRPLKEWQASPIIENDEDIERHSVVLAETVKRQKHNPQHNSFFRSQPFDTSRPEPIAVFEFVYGSEAFIRKTLGQYKSSGSCFSTAKVGSFPLDPQSHPNINVKPSKGIITYGSPTKRSRSRDTSISPAECWRCKDAGVACIPNGGTSATCQRCTKLRKGCNLPRMVQQAAAKRQKLANRTKTTELGPESRSHFAMKNGSEAVIKDSDTSNSSEPGSETELRYPKRADTRAREVNDSSESSDHSSEETQDCRPTYRRLRKHAGSIAEASSNKRKLRDAIPKVTRDSGNDKKTSHAAEASCKPTTEGKVPYKKLSQAAQAEKTDTWQLLQSVKAFSEQLMELVTCSEQDELITDVVLDLVNKCDASFRSLQVYILRKTKEKRGDNCDMRSKA